MPGCLDGGKLGNPFKYILIPANYISACFVLKLFLDQNFNHRILRGLFLRIPLLDFKSTQLIGIPNEIDPRILKLAAAEDRVILTHDRRTFPRFAYESIEAGEKVSGILVVPSDFAIGEAIFELEIIVTCSDERDYEGKVEFLPMFK